MALQKQQRVVDSLLHLMEDMPGRLKRLEELYIYTTPRLGSGASGIAGDCRAGGAG